MLAASPVKPDSRSSPEPSAKKPLNPLMKGVEGFLRSEGNDAPVSMRCSETDLREHFLRSETSRAVSSCAAPPRRGRRPRMLPL